MKELDINQPTKEQFEKYEHLLAYLRELGSVAVAFSGGVDSTFLLYAAKEALGDSMIALTVTSESFPEREIREANDYCAKEGIRQFVCKTSELEIPGFAENPKDRCYICKKELFRNMMSVAKEQGMAAVAEGSNMDDNGDYRPGLLAVAELGVYSPLRACEIWKADIRALSKYFGLPTWKKQSFACLASRFPYGEMITADRLHMVDRAEQLLLDLGFTQFRVRIHQGNLARIELLPEEFAKVMADDVRMLIYQKLKEYGFAYISLDLLGYRTGSMNETLKNQ